VSSRSYLNVNFSQHSIRGREVNRNDALLVSSTVIKRPTAKTYRRKYNRL